MEEPRGPRVEETQGPESERGPQELPEDTPVDLEILRESTVAAEGESYSNLADETTGNQTDTAEGDVLDSTSNHSDGINESGVDMEIISNLCSATGDVKLPPSPRCEVILTALSIAGELLCCDHKFCGVGCLTQTQKGSTLANQSSPVSPGTIDEETVVSSTGTSMEESGGIRGDATPRSETVGGPQELLEEATVDQDILRASPVAAEGKSYSNQAGETTGNQTDAAEGDMLDLPSNHCDGISEVDSDLEIISNSCSDTAECIQIPEETTRMDGSLAGERNSTGRLSPNVVCETSYEVQSDKAEHRESADDLNLLSKKERRKLREQTAAKQKFGSSDVVLTCGPENKPGSRKVLERGNISLGNEKGVNIAAECVSYSSTTSVVTGGVTEENLLNLDSNQSGGIREDNSDVEIISHLCCGPPESLQVPEGSTQIDVSRREVTSSYVGGCQLTGSFTGGAKEIQSINGQNIMGKQKTLPVRPARPLLSTLHLNPIRAAHLTKCQRRNLMRKQTKQLVPAARGDNLSGTTKNQSQKLRRMLQTHQVAATCPGQVGSTTDDLSHLSKKQRKKLRRMQREQAAAAEKQKLRNSDVVLTCGLENEPGSQKHIGKASENLTNEKGGSIAAVGVSYSSSISEVTGNGTEVPNTGGGDRSNLASNCSGVISEADSDVEIVFHSCQGTIEMQVPQVTTKTEGSPEGKKRARECSSPSPVCETACEVSSGKAKGDESTNDLSHLTKRKRRNTCGEKQAAGAHEDGDIVSAQRPESESGSQEIPGDATVKQTVIMDKTAAAGGELLSSVLGGTVKNPTDFASTCEGHQANLSSNNLAGNSEGDSDVEILFQSNKVAPECIVISDDASKIYVSPGGGKKTAEVPSSSVVGTHLTYGDKQMASNDELSHLPKKKRTNWKESEQHIQKLKLRKEQAVTSHVKNNRKGEVSLTKVQKRTLNNLLLSVGIIRGHLSAMQNHKLGPVKAAVAAGNVSIHSEVLQKFVAEVRGQAAGSVGSVKANERVRTRTIDSSVEAAKAVKPPQAKHFSAVEKRISKIQKGYQSWVPSSEPVNKTQSEDAVRNDVIKNTKTSENVTCMGKTENAQCLNQYLYHQMTIKNLLQKDDTKFVVRVPVFNTQDEELEFIAKHLKKTVGDSIFRGPDGLGLPPDIEPNFSQQSCNSDYNSNLPSSSAVTESELYRTYDQQIREQRPSPVLKLRFKESNPPGSCDVKYSDSGPKQLNPLWSHESKFVDSFPQQSLEPQITVNCSLQAQEPLITSRNPVEANNQVSTGTSPVHLPEPRFRVTIPTFPYDSLHSERNAPEWSGTGASHPVTLERCGRSRSPHSSREGSYRSISSHRSYEGSHTSRSSRGPQERYERSRSSLRFQNCHGGSRSPLRFRVHSHRSRSPLRDEEQFHTGRSLTRSRELFRHSSPDRSYNTQLLRGRRAARSRDTLVHIKLSQFNGGGRR